MIWLNHFFRKKKPIIEYTDSPKFILSVLKKLKNRHSTLTVYFNGDKKQYVTMVIDVDKNKKQFLLDEMVPREGHKKASYGDPFRLTASDNGIAIIFKAKVRNTITKDNTQCYLVDFPENIEYKQRRKAYRVPINADNNVPIQINHPEYKWDNLQMKDISFTGTAFVVKDQNLENQIKINDALEQLIITTKENKSIYLKLEIRRVYYMEREESTLIAGRFIDLTHNQQRSIELFVSELERENIRQKQEQE
jgi:c-di-GMP-binding flagellar brake protein YcgR